MTRNPPVKLSPPDFDCAQLIVVGDVMLDWYWHGSTSRISPEAPVPVVHVQTEETRVGGAGNVALNAAALGARVRLLGLAGQDAHADRIEELLREGGVDCVLQRVAGSKTITKLRILSRHQQMIRADFEDHFPERNGDELIFSFERQLHEVDAVDADIDWHTEMNEFNPANRMIARTLSFSGCNHAAAMLRASRTSAGSAA
jgi:D-beta-D-heptose 7-phosphate kinase/D-beta-D-heptose 1-phosphate adenosyltransferase